MPDKAIQDTIAEAKRLEVERQKRREAKRELVSRAAGAADGAAIGTPRADSTQADAQNDRDGQDDDEFEVLRGGRSGRVRMATKSAVPGRLLVGGELSDGQKRRLIVQDAAPTEPGPDEAWVELPTARTVKELQDWLAEQRRGDAVQLYADHLLVVGDCGGAGIIIPLGYDPEEEA